MDLSELEALVAEGENQYVEFKLEVRHVDVLVREIVAFANTDGGTLLCGVGDDGTLVGIQTSEVKRLMVRLKKVQESLPVVFRVDAVQAGASTEGLDAYVVVISVPRAPDEIAPVRTASGEVYARVDDRVLMRRDFVPRADGLQSSSAEKLTMFIAMSFRFEEQPALVDYYEAILRAVSSSKLPIDPLRMDLEQGDYEITTEIITRIHESSIVLADFTFNSPNVYFEAGVAVGAKKRLIRTARKDTEMAFDIRTSKILLYANATQLERGLPAALKAAYDDVIKARA
ncbi:AlbA family DNA-binding domain-containing protein [Saccharothrix sp. Mg75]|uniref:AlbA family DNA-binding domain-containing protein n=1 Tax=Saccharothrix sp. Mg75 TaxID=3445357 RepID=UPI003EEC72C4